MSFSSFNEKLGRDYWEKQAEQAWLDLGNTKANPSPQSPTQNDLNYDAFRHAFTSATWTQNPSLGSPGARLGGDYIETSNPRNFSSEKGQRDMRGDLINNQKGREIGGALPPDPPQARLRKKLMSLLRREIWSQTNKTTPGP